eukprot:TRINITY_DN7495_c0_g1_i1.p1 TRINITY_DN7495_c0_g1~~TRINITY_DN7495_c0_g1_i1.p1  ORF type:complete len:207 (-),score=54.67 TRINITY_DN7495_c0_g1_i1:637-1173(-)
MLRSLVGSEMCIRDRCSDCCAMHASFGGVPLRCCEECHAKRSEGAMPDIAEWIAEKQGMDSPSTIDIVSAVSDVVQDPEVVERMGRRNRKDAAACEGEQDSVEELSPEAVVQWGATLLEATADRGTLAQLRYKLVPGRVKEEVFWRRFLAELSERVFGNLLRSVRHSPANNTARRSSH